MFEGSEGTNEFPYQFSPDGSTLLLERHGTEPSYKVNGEFGYRLVIVPADGEGPDIPIGPAIPSSSGGATAEFSPDGTQVLAFYDHDSSTWLLAADGSGGEEVDWNPARCIQLAAPGSLSLTSARRGRSPDRPPSARSTGPRRPSSGFRAPRASAGWHGPS